MEAAATTLHDPPLPKYTDLRCPLPTSYLVSSSILLLTRRFLRFLTPSSNSVEIMLPEISIKRDLVRAGIRLNLSNYSSRGQKETFRMEDRLARGFEPIYVHRAARTRAHLLFSLKSLFSLFLYTFPLNLSLFALCLSWRSLCSPGTSEPDRDSFPEGFPDILPNSVYFPSDSLSKSWSTKFM